MSNNIYTYGLHAARYMTPFERAWSLLKADWREVSPGIFQDMEPKPLSEQEIDEMIRPLAVNQGNLNAAEAQAFPEGNLPDYHPAIYGLMNRKEIQTTFNEGKTRDEIEMANLFSNMKNSTSGLMLDGQPANKEYTTFPAGEPMEYFERDEFDDELVGVEPFNDEMRRRMNYDEVMGRLTRESTGHARAPSDEHIY